MATTTPDAIYYPSDYNLPADVPNDMQKAAASTQTALNKRMSIAMTTGACAMPTGWQGGPAGSGAPMVDKTGRVCVARGMYVRTATLTVTDNQEIQLGDVPAGFRPYQSVRCSAMWAGTSSGNANVSAGMLIVYTTGDLYFYPNFSGTMAVGQWISLGGLSWVTP